MKTIEHRPPLQPFAKDFEPTIFLAGPIQGAPDWQSNALHVLARNHDDNSLHVFNPRRYDNDTSDFDYTEQAKWEVAQLEQARKFGTVLFWFSAKIFSEDNPQEQIEAELTQLELHRVLGWRDYDDTVQTIVGFDKEYSGEDKRYIEHACYDLEIPIINDFFELCLNARKMSVSKYAGRIV